MFLIKVNIFLNINVNILVKLNIWKTMICYNVWIWKFNENWSILACKYQIVVTLALGSQSRQGFARVRAKKEAQESHFMLPGK
jgi:hypothetical protein